MRAKRINVVPNDVDRESFRSTNKRRFQLLFIGKLARSKGANLISGIISWLENNIPGLEFFGLCRSVSHICLSSRQNLSDIRFS
jgi:hypothetical protein